VAQDFTEAMRWYRLAADQGYAYVNAQSSVGLMYLQGQDVTQNHGEARPG